MSKVKQRGVKEKVTQRSLKGLVQAAAEDGGEKSLYKKEGYKR